MLKARVIPCLDVKDGRVVKGVNFVDLRDAGDPVESGQGSTMPPAPTSSVSSTSPRATRTEDTMLDVVARTAEQCFMPLTVGGGVRTVEDIRKLLLAGADKVSINTAAVARSATSSAEAAEKFGSQCIVVAVDAKREDGAGAGASPVSQTSLVSLRQSSPTVAASRPVIDAIGWCQRMVEYWGRRDPADINGPGRNQDRLRHRFDAGNL